MTIATSVVVHPSRCLLFSICGLASLALVAAILILIGSYEFSWSTRLHICAIASIFVGMAVFKAGRYRKTFHIDISGIGQIRLTQYSGVSATDTKMGMALDGHSGHVVHLCPDSVLWADLLLLRLKPDQGATLSLPVVRDSVKGAGFAELAVACRYIATRGAETEAEFID